MDLKLDPDVEAVFWRAEEIYFRSRGIQWLEAAHRCSLRADYWERMGFCGSLLGYYWNKDWLDEW